MSLLKEAKKTIRMTAEGPEGYVESTVEYDDFVSWPELIDQFNNFLAAQGYMASFNQFVEQKQETQ